MFLNPKKENNIIDTNMSSVRDEVDSKLPSPIFSHTRDDENIPEFDSSGQRVNSSADDHTIVCH